MIVVADPRDKREIYHDHGNGPHTQDQTNVLIICGPYLRPTYPDPENSPRQRIGARSARRLSGGLQAVGVGSGVGRLVGLRRYLGQD
jgi:hypothetical protein